MEQSHSEKLAYFEETISDYDRQNTRLKNRISELQSELKVSWQYLILSLSSLITEMFVVKMTYFFKMRI